MSAGKFVVVAESAPSRRPKRVMHDGEWKFEASTELVGPCVSALSEKTGKPRVVTLPRASGGYLCYAIEEGALPADVEVIGETEVPDEAKSATFWPAEWDRFVAAMAKANAPKRSAFPKERWKARLTDDDGVLVLASRSRLASHYAESEFDYSYPRALLEGAGQGLLAAWSTEEEGTVSLALALGQPDASFVRVGTIQLAADDALLAMPYSSFTLTCANDRGVVAKKTPKALSTSLPVPAGRYDVHVRRAKELSFEAFLEPISHDTQIAPPTEVVPIA